MTIAINTEPASYGYQLDVTIDEGEQFSASLQLSTPDEAISLAEYLLNTIPELEYEKRQLERELFKLQNQSEQKVAAI